MAEESATAATRCLVSEAARRLGVPLEPRSEASLPQRDDLPAALAEFLRLNGVAGSPLRRAWFPRYRVGGDVIEGGRAWARRTAEQAGVDPDVYRDGILLRLMGRSSGSRGAMTPIRRFST